MVVLGDAFTGHVNPLLVLVSAATASVGFAGLIYEIRNHRRNQQAQPDHREPVPEPADTG